MTSTSLITGVSSGLGTEYARQLSPRGFQLAEALGAGIDDGPDCLRPGHVLSPGPEDVRPAAVDEVTHMRAAVPAVLVAPRAFQIADVGADLQRLRR